MATGPSTSGKLRESIGYIEGLEGELNGPRKRPFYRIRFNRDQVRRLLAYLRRCTEAKWFTLTATYEKPNRLRITKNLRVPDYERRASQIYLRGEAVRVSGDQGSCNIDFSGQVGRALLQENIRAAERNMEEYLDIQIPNRKRNLIEFIPDTESRIIEADEQQRLAEAGAVLAGEVLPAEDFSHWPGAGRG